MAWMKSHPWATLLVGVGLGMAFGSKIKGLPVVGQVAAKIPTA